MTAGQQKPYLCTAIPGKIGGRVGQGDRMGSGKVGFGSEWIALKIGQHGSGQNGF